jgi:hypothetical protein
MVLGLDGSNVTPGLRTTALRTMGLRRISRKDFSIVKLPSVAGCGVGS